MREAHPFIQQIQLGPCAMVAGATCCVPCRVVGAGDTALSRTVPSRNILGFGGLCGCSYSALQKHPQTWHSGSGWPHPGTHSSIKPGGQPVCRMTLAQGQVLPSSFFSQCLLQNISTPELILEDPAPILVTSSLCRRGQDSRVCCRKTPPVMG